MWRGWDTLSSDLRRSFPLVCSRQVKSSEPVPVIPFLKQSFLFFISVFRSPLLPLMLVMGLFLHTQKLPSRLSLACLGKALALGEALGSSVVTSPGASRYFGKPFPALYPTAFLMAYPPREFVVAEQASPSLPTFVHTGTSYYSDHRSSDLPIVC